MCRPNRRPQVDAGAGRCGGFGRDALIIAGKRAGLVLVVGGRCENDPLDDGGPGHANVQSEFVDDAEIGFSRGGFVCRRVLAGQVLGGAEDETSAAIDNAFQQSQFNAVGL
jgi:hypothetical protein